MANQGGGNTKIWLTGGLILFLLIGLPALAAGIGGMGGAQDQSNELGAKAAERFDVTDTRSREFLNKIEALTQPEQFLELNADKIRDIKQQITDIEAHWTTNTVLSGNDLTTAKEKLAEVNKKLDKVLELLGNLNPQGRQNEVPNKEEVLRLQEDIVNLIEEVRFILERATARLSGTQGDVVSMAKALIERNGDGNGTIPYRTGMSPDLQLNQIKDGKYGGQSLVDIAKSMDCSGFVSYVLVSNGLLPSRQFTESLANNQKNFTEINADLDANQDGRLQKEEIKTAAETGKLKPGDVIISGLASGRKVKGRTHASIVLEGNYSGGQSIGHSTNRGGKNGPQYTSIERRAGIMNGMRYGSNVTFLRPKY